MTTKVKRGKSPAVKERRLALLICNTMCKSMPNHHLAGPAHDAKALDAILSNKETCGFTVRTLVDRGLLEARREIARICSEVTERDTLLLYYSGNGFKGPDESLYLLVVDSDAEYLHATALDTEFILSQLRGSKCRRIVLLVDCCLAGAFFNNNRGIPNGLYAITACGEREYSSDLGAGKGGAFTVALCAGLRNGAADLDGDGLISVEELHAYTKKAIQSTGFHMTPQKWVWNVPEPIYMTTVPKHVFFSYARKNMAQADVLSEALRQEGLAVWIDRIGIQSGNWKERVLTGLNNAKALVVLLTPEAFASEAVRKELAFAAKKGVPIIPVMLDEIKVEQIPDWFTWDYDELHRHVLKAKSYSSCVKSLAQAILDLRKPAAKEEVVT